MDVEQDKTTIFLVNNKPVLEKDIRQQTTFSKNCGSYSLKARIKILTETYCSHQYLSIDPNKVCQSHFNAHKPRTNLKK